MKITLHDGRKFDIWFRYDNLAKITTAHLRDLEDNIEYYGVAVCSREDQFNKKVGRKVALKRLFDVYFPEKSSQNFRTNIWKSLTNRGMKLA